MSGSVFRAESDAAGHYKLVSLPAGRYSLWVKAAGHDSVWIREVVVDRGQTAHHDIQLGKVSQPARLRTVPKRPLSPAGDASTTIGSNGLSWRPPRDAADFIS